MRESAHLLALAFAAVFLASPGALATGQGDYCVHVSNGVPGYFDAVLIGYTNTLEIWIANDDLLGGMSPAIELQFEVDFSWDMGYGNFPPVQEHGRAVGAWNLPSLQVVQDFDDVSPEHLLIGGAAMPGSGLPAGPSELCYSLQFDIPVLQPETIPGLYIYPYFYPPAGTWTFSDSGGGYPPDFCGQPVAGEVDPVADPATFDVIEMPCLPPIWTSTPPATVAWNHCLDYSFQLQATEGGNTPPADPVTYGGDFTSPDGTINVPAPGSGGCGSTDLQVYAANAVCQGTPYDFTINWTNNAPSVMNCPAGAGKVAKGSSWVYTFSASDPDTCDQLTWSVTHIGTAPAGTYSINNLGEFAFNTDDADGGMTYSFEACVEDNCGDDARDCCQFDVQVMFIEPFIIRLDKTHNSLQGHYEYIDITKVAGSEEIGGFDFLIAYDASALNFMSATIGDAIDANDCGWEYFTYRYGPFGNCSGPCPSGFARIVAIADINNGPNHPACTYVPNGGSLAILKFYVTNDRTYECMYVPIRFVWMDCGDNGVSSATGDTLFISDHVFDYEWNGDFSNPDYEITWLDCDFGGAFYYGGACEWCDVSDKVFPVRFIWFWNGGVDIACADSIDERGDINLNGVPNEIADVVLFTNYFLYGIGVFHIALQGQIAATDINNDGLVLTVGDLVYLTRVITGDVLPFDKLAPFADAAEINLLNGTVSSEAATELGGVFARFAIEGAYDVINHTELQLLANEIEGELRVLLYSGLENMTRSLAAGSNRLFTVRGDATLLEIEVADYNGNLLAAHVSKGVTPSDYLLHQNVPNPFNPTTEIRVELPNLCDWEIGIYNINGQLIETFSGTDVGVVNVKWDATDNASGLYLYKLTAGAFSDTKKMLLIK